MKTRLQTPVQIATQLECAPLVREVYEMVQSYLKNEAARQTLIESKATALLSGVGLSITIALSFVASNLKQGGVLSSFANAEQSGLMVLLVIAVASGICAAGAALLALLIKSEQLAPNAAAIFNKKRLAKADALEDDYAVREYRRYLIPHLWEIAEQETLVLERKARSVAIGQKLFFVFIISIGVVAIIICGHRPEDAKSSLKATAGCLDP